MRYQGAVALVRRAAAGLLLLAATIALLGSQNGRFMGKGFSQATPDERLERAAERFRALGSGLLAAADRAAALPEAKDALRGERGALAGLFRSLETLQALRDSPALTIHALPFAKVAWARPTADLRGLEDLVGERRGLHILQGSVTTTLLAASPVLAHDGRLLGLATAEMPVRVERNIQNQYLDDFDLVEGTDPEIEVTYRDVRAATRALALPGEPGQLPLLDLEGDPLGAVALRKGPSGVAASPAWHRAAATVLWAALLLAALAGAYGLTGVTLFFLAGRAALTWLGPPWPLPARSPGEAPLTFASSLFATPADALLTAVVAASLAALLCRLAFRVAPTRPRLLGLLISPVLALPVLGLFFGLIGKLVEESPWDLATVSLFPRSASHLVMQGALLLLFAAALLLLVALLSLGGPLPETTRGRLQRSMLWALLGTGAHLLWPREIVGLPLAPAVLLFLAAALAAGSRARWVTALRLRPAGPRAGFAVLLVAGLSLLLHPTLVHFAEKAQRRRIEGEYASLVRTQSAWRGQRLQEALHQVDGLPGLEDPGRSRLGQEELAFSVWSETSLSTAGLASAVEIQDATGSVISRFALDLPALLASTPAPGLPRGTGWTTARERLQVASAVRQVLHARRAIQDQAGRSLGALHLYLGDDVFDLPFLPRRDPISALFRSAPGLRAREEPVALTIYAAPGTVVWSSAERPPALSVELLERVRGAPSGLWTTLLLDGRAHHTFLLAHGDALYSVSYPRLSAPAFLAGLSEALAGLGGAALLIVLALMLVRTLGGARSLSLPPLVAAIRERFALRLFVSLVGAAVLPVAALEVAFRGYVAERLRRESEEQALERAAVAQRAVDDFAFYQRGEGPGRAAVTDTALVWVARLIRGDVDVFKQGRLLASSKREVFSSGLLPSTVPGPVFRALTLEGANSVLRTERIGAFSALVAYVPVKIDGVEPGILALPQAMKEREVREALLEFDRSMRLASLAFLALAAGLALSLSRPLSGPIRELTRATRRIASGDLEVLVHTKSRDELRELVDSFNQMASDLARQRKDLARSNRLAAWADMARQVAHEVKNPLTPIQLSAEHLQRVFRDGAPDFAATLTTCTETILRQVRTLRGIVTEFSAFARPPAPDLQTVDARSLVEDAVRPYRTSLPPGVRLEVEALDHLPALRLDRRLAARAVVNLVENALHAVGEEGRIGVRVGTSEDGRFVEILVEDDGSGLGPEALVRAFEPFFSTKSQGSGLGLALVRRVAEDHGGTATLTRGTDGQTRAVLRFPLAEDQGRVQDAPKDDERASA